VRAENNSVTYQNKNTLTEAGTDLRGQIDNTFFDPRVDLPFDLDYEIED